MTKATFEVSNTDHFSFDHIFINLRKVTIYLLTSCNTEEKIAQNIYIHNSNRNYKKLATKTILIKNRIGKGYKNYGKQCPGLEFRFGEFSILRSN